MIPHAEDASHREMVVREVSIEEIPLVHGLEELCFKDPYPRSFLQYLAQTNPRTFFVAFVGERLVGYAVASPESSYSHLISIAVHPEERRKGIGQVLLSTIEAILDASETLRLEVRESNASAIAFYMKNGFQETGLKKSYYSDSENAIIMSKTRQDS